MLLQLVALKLRRRLAEGDDEPEILAAPEREPEGLPDGVRDGDSDPEVDTLPHNVADAHKEPEPVDVGTSDSVALPDEHAAALLVSDGVSDSDTLPQVDAVVVTHADALVHTLEDSEPDTHAEREDAVLIVSDTLKLGVEQGDAVGE